MSTALRHAIEIRDQHDPAPAGDEHFKLARLLELRSVIDTMRSQGDSDLMNEVLAQRCASDPS